MLVLLLVNGHSKSFAHIVDYCVNNLGQLLAVNSTPIAPYRQSLPLQVLTGNGGWKCKNRHNKPHCRISCGSANIGKVAAYIPKTVVTHRDCYYSFVLYSVFHWFWITFSPHNLVGSFSRHSILAIRISTFPCGQMTLPKMRQWSVFFFITKAKTK